MGGFLRSYTKRFRRGRELLRPLGRDSPARCCRPAPRQSFLGRRNPPWSAQSTLVGRLEAARRDAPPTVQPVAPAMRENHPADIGLQNPDPKLHAKSDLKCSPNAITAAVTALR